MPSGATVIASWSGNWPVDPLAWPLPLKALTSVSPRGVQLRPPSVERESSKATPYGEVPWYPKQAKYAVPSGPNATVGSPP
ncbi:MAG: hypothetical protein ACXWLM_11285 [Myxococcales bacterium]